MLIGTLASLEIVRRQLHRQLQERLGHSVEGVMLEIEQARTELYLGAKALSSEQELCSAFHKADLQLILKELIQAKNVMGIDSVTALGADGTALGRAHEPGRFGDAVAADDVATRALRGREYAGMAAGERGIEIEVALPVYTGTGPDIGGVLKVAKLLDYAFLARLKTKFGLEVMLYNDQRLQGTTFVDADVVTDPDHSALQQRVGTHKQRVDTAIWLGTQEYFITAMPLQSQQKQVLGTLMLALSQKSVHQTVKNFSLVSGLVGLCLLLATAIVCYRVSLNIVHPVQTLSSMASKVAKGDMGQRVQVPSGDEIGQLAIALNEMTQDLQRTTTSIDALNQEIDTRKQAESRLEHANQLLMASEQQLRASNQQLMASEQQLRASNQQLTASEQQLRAANQQLRTSEEKYRSLVQNIPGVVWTTDEKGQTSFISSNIEQVYGFSAQEIYARGSELWLGRIHPDDVERVKQSFAAVFAERVPLDVEYRIRHRQGHWIWLHDTSIGAYEKDGVKYANGVFSDITQRKQTEEALHRERSLNAELFKTTPAFAVAIDAEGKTVMMNDAMCRALGYHFDEVKGADYLTTFIPDRDREKLADVMKTLNTTGESTVNENAVLTRDGRELLVEWHGSQVFNTQGEFEFLFGVGIDVTKRKQTEERLARYQKRLRSLASELSLTEEHERRKMAGYLHDGPCQQLAVCLLHLETVRAASETANREPVAEICQMIHQTVQDLRDLTFDLSPPTLYLVGFEAALEELLKEELRDRHNIPYDFERANISPLLSDDLRALLYQSVRELLHNTVKYAQASKVTVTTGRAGNCVEVNVCDDGTGFDVNVIGPSVSKTGGYGLFNMKERLTYIGGELDIQSQPGQGSRFTIKVPLEMKAQLD